MILKQKELGAKGEEIAARYLKKKGYRIIERNFRTRIGEIDIIAEHDRELVFIEVKTRTDVLFGSPFESVTPQKQKQLSKVALDYMNKMDCHDLPARFDVVGIEIREEGGSAKDVKIDLLQNAFDLCNTY